jgi:hypothetical protein
VDHFKQDSQKHDRIKIESEKKMSDIQKDIDCQIWFNKMMLPKKLAHCLLI